MAKETTENSTSSEQSQSSRRSPPSRQFPSLLPVRLRRGSWQRSSGPVGAVVGGVVGAMAGKSAATGEPIAETARKAIAFPRTAPFQSKAAASYTSAQKTAAYSGKSPNPRGAQRLRKSAKARPAKRAALAGRDRRNRVTVEKPQAAAWPRGERRARWGEIACASRDQKATLRGNAKGRASAFERESGQGWIRTSEGVSQQIYSLPRLATWVPTRLRALIGLI